MSHITKESFLAAQACPTLAWLDRRDEGGAPSAGDLLRMEQGMEVHRRARALVPGAVRIHEAVMDRAAARTRQVMADPAVTAVFEAAFSVAEQVTGRVKRWRGGDMRWRWCAAGLLHAEQHFRRVAGYRYIGALLSALGRIGGAVDGTEKVT